MTIIEGHRIIRSAVGEYNFALDGGAVGTMVMRGNEVPLNAIIIGSQLNVLVVPTGGTVTDTLSIGFDAVADVQAAAARNAAPWSTTGVRHGTLAFASVPLRNAAQRRPRFTINGTGLTGGHVRVILWFVEVF